MAEKKDIRKRKRPRPSKQKMRTNHLLIIGIDRYIDSGIARLNNAVRDAKAFKKILVEQFQFEEKNVTTLFNEEATRSNILKTFGTLLKELTEEDNLIFYYSGHGEQMTMGIGERGFWIPSDAVVNNEWTYIPNAEILNLFKYSKAHHIFGIVDSCFSGGLFVTKRLTTAEQRIDSIKSRWLLTAGRIEVVSDGSLGQNSPFATPLLHFLKELPDDAIWVSDLCNLVLQGMEYNTENQTPRGEPLQGVGHLGGQFIFYKKGYQPITAPSTKPASTEKKKSSTKSASKEEEMSAGSEPKAPALEPTTIDNSDNVVNNSTIHAGGNVHIGDIINPPEPEEDLNLGEGKLLYDIPNNMKVQETAICKVRIAKERKILLEDLRTSAKTTIKDLKQITEVMSVELVDVSGGNNFTIIAGTSEEQYIDQHSYTEWTFFVTPKRPGDHLLQIKISTVKIINNKERQKDIALLETISVITDAAPAPSSTLPQKSLAPKNIQEVKTHLEELLIEDLKKALEAYRKIIKSEDRTIIQQLARYNRNQKDFRSGGLSKEYYDRTNAQISNALTEMIQDLEEEDIRLE